VGVADPTSVNAYCAMNQCVRLEWRIALEKFQVLPGIAERFEVLPTILRYLLEAVQYKKSVYANPRCFDNKRTNKVRRRSGNDVR
jgi:hypothetical protein